jgi:hypothetical protein
MRVAALLVAIIALVLAPQSAGAAPSQLITCMCATALL